MTQSTQRPDIDSLLRSFPLPPKDRKPTMNRIHWPFHSQPVLLLVGHPTPHRFYVHEELLVSVSEFFRAALDTRLPLNFKPNKSLPSAGFLESITKTVTLPDENPGDIEYFLQWLYLSHCTSRSLIDKPAEDTTTPANQNTSKPGNDTSATTEPLNDTGCPTTSKLCAPQHALWHPMVDGRLSAESKKNNKYPAFSPLIRLYFLSDRLCIPTSAGLRDQILDHFHYVAIEANAMPGAADIKKIWDQTKQEEKYIRIGEGHITMKGRKNRFRQLILDLFRVLRTNQVLMKGLSDSEDILIREFPDHVEDDDLPASTLGADSFSCLDDYDAQHDHTDCYPRDFLADLVFDCIQYGVKTGKERRKICYQPDTRSFVVKRKGEVVSTGWMGLDRSEARCLYHEHAPVEVEVADVKEDDEIMQED